MFVLNFGGSTVLDGRETRRFHKLGCRKILCQSPVPHDLDQRSAHLGWGWSHSHVSLFESFNFGLGRSFSARDDCTGVSHPPAGRRGDTGDEGHHRLGAVLSQVRRGLLFSLTTNLSDHDYTFWVGVIDKNV